MKGYGVALIGNANKGFLHCEDQPFGFFIDGRCETGHHLLAESSSSFFTFLQHQSWHGTREHPLSRVLRNDKK